MPGRNIARITTFLLLIFALAVIACAAAGLSAAQRNDVSRAAEQHRSLEATLGELRGLFGDSVHFDSDQLAQIERRSGLNDLRFDAELTADSGREVQSLHDTQGRIIGWLSWAPDRALTATMNWRWGGAGLFGHSAGARCRARAWRDAAADPLVAPAMSIWSAKAHDARSAHRTGQPARAARSA
ncbi:MAG: hypothetical protein WBQ55_09610 [Xanthobacteraceae bacterium]